MPKFAWVVLPLALYGAWLGIALLRRRRPSRHALNVQLSVLLMIYLLATAGLGIFWVANQQLPVFDWHYLFGYGTLLLVALHLWFNLPVVWRALRGPPRAARPPGRLRPQWIAAAAIATALATGYLLGIAAAPPAPVPHADAVQRFHEQSSLSRAGVLRGAPGIDWGDAPPPFKRYTGVPLVDPGRADAARAGLSAAWREATARNGPLRLAELGELLHLAAGVTLRRGGVALRAAPSSGGLFPSELYVLARRVGGLAPGVYHYDADRALLAAIGPLPEQEDDADATVVLTAVFRRTGHKYGERAWRYAAADAGHVLENLRVASRAAGIDAVLANRFDETRLARALAIDGVDEAPLAVMALHAGRKHHTTTARRFATAPPAAQALGATSAIQQATSLRHADPPARQAFALPPAGAATMPVARAIAERRSQRRFAPAPVPLAALASLLADVDQPDQLSGAIVVHVIVNRVHGLAPGVYRYVRGHQLERVRAGDFAAAAQSAALAQQVIGDAAAVLVLAADRAVLAADGARGYRHAFIEAGLLGERWLLGATARGLGACPVGAFYDRDAAALIGTDMARTWVLHFAALGVPAR